MTDKNNISEVTDMTKQNVANDPVATGKINSGRIADAGGAGDPMPTVDPKNGPSTKAEVIMYTADYIAGLTNDNALEFFNKIAAEIKAKDATYTGGTRASTTAMASLMTKEDLDLVFASDESLSEDFKAKASVIFESAVSAAMVATQAKLEESYEAKLEEATTVVRNEVNERITKFVDFVAERWLEENKKAIEAQIRTEAVDSFLGGLRNLFAEHYVEIPADKVDAVESLAAQADALEAQVNEEANKNIEANAKIVALETEINTLKAAAVLESTIEALTDTQKEKVRSLVGVYEGGSLEDYTSKVSTISETVVAAPVKTINEDSTVDPVEAPVVEAGVSSEMKAYLDFIRRSKA